MGKRQRAIILPPSNQHLQMDMKAWAAPAVAVAIYALSLLSEFIRDDTWQIVKNPQIQSWDYLPRLLFTHLWSQSGAEHAVHFYRPFFSVWMLVVNTFAGLSPAWWHFSSILLHAATAFAVYKLSERILQNRAAALFAALMFAVHPIHVDGVSWVSASNEILFTLFALNAILALLPQDAHAQMGTARLAASAMFYAAALLTKETAIVISPILLVIVLLRRQGAKAATVATAGLWYLSATAAYFAARWWALQRIGTEESKHSWREVLLTSPSVLVFYLRKLFFPIHLSTFYMNPIPSTPTFGTWMTVVGLLVTVALVVWVALRDSPVVGVAASMILLPLLPALLAIRIYDQGDMTHDRYLYLPSVGLCLMFGLLAKWALTGPKAGQVIFTTAGIAILLGLAVLTIYQQQFYKNNEAFYERAIALYPTNVYAIDGVGSIHLANGESDRAINEFRTAYQLAPSNPDAIYNLAHGFFETKQYAEAEPLFRQVENSPAAESQRKAILLALADTEITLGNLASGQDVLQRLERLDPRFPALHRTLGILFQKEGRITDAQAEYHREFHISGDMQAERQAIALQQRIGSN